MKESGMFGGGSGAATSNIDLDIEKIRGERMMMMRKWELEAQKDAWTRDAEDRRTDTLLTLFAPFAGAIAGVGSQRMKELGQQQAAAHNPTSPHSSPPAAAPQQMVQLRCACGYQGKLPLTDPPPEEIVCPECKQKLIVTTPKPPIKEGELNG